MINAIGDVNCAGKGRPPRMELSPGHFLSGATITSARLSPCWVYVLFDIGSMDHGMDSTVIFLFIQLAFP